MVTATWPQIIFGIVSLSLTLTVWWFKRNDKIIKEREDAKKEITDAIASGDVARIHRVIDLLRR